MTRHVTHFPFVDPAYDFIRTLLQTDLRSIDHGSSKRASSSLIPRQYSSSAVASHSLFRSLDGEAMPKTEPEEQ